MNKICIPKQEFFQRVKNLQALMEKEDYDIILSYGNEAEPQYCRYFSNYWPSFETAAVLIPKKGDAMLLIGPESYTYAADRSVIPEIRMLKAFRESSEPEYPDKPLDTFAGVFKEALKGEPLKKIGIAGYSLATTDLWAALNEELKGKAQIKNASCLVNSLRMIKTENELNCMREAARITRETFFWLLDNIRTGLTECQVAGMAIGKMHELGAERESYPCWVLTGDGSDQAISRPRQKQIKQGEMTFIQIGARYEGYASSIGRAVVFGKADESQKRLINSAYSVYNTVTGAIKDGVPARQIAQIHKKAVEEAGLADHYLYGPCHGNGLMEGEAPWIEVNSGYDLKENMTFCADIFLGSSKTRRGLRIEDVIRVTKSGIENLTNFPCRLFEIER